MNKEKIKYFLWATGPILFGLFLAVLATNNIDLGKTTPRNNTLADILAKKEELTGGRQENFYFFKNPSEKLKIGAEAYYVGDLDTKDMILEKNQDSKLPIASLSKLMTAAISK